jgi:hypothetical protein
MITTIRDRAVFAIAVSIDAGRKADSVSMFRNSLGKDDLAT